MFLSLLSPSGTTGVFQRTLRGIVVASTATLVGQKFATLDQTLAPLSSHATTNLTSFANSNQTLDDASVVSQATKAIKTPASRTAIVSTLALPVFLPERTAIQLSFGNRTFLQLNYYARTFYPKSYLTRTFLQLPYETRTGIPNGS